MTEPCFAYKWRTREEIIDYIEILRQRLAYLINTKENLDDPEILISSQNLDVALNEYYIFIEEAKNYTKSAGSRGL